MKIKYNKEKIGSDIVSFLVGSKHINIKEINGEKPTMDSFFRVKSWVEAIYGTNNQWATFNVPFK